MKDILLRPLSFSAESLKIALCSAEDSAAFIRVIPRRVSLIALYLAEDSPAFYSGEVKSTSIFLLRRVSLIALCSAEDSPAFISVTLNQHFLPSLQSLPSPQSLSNSPCVQLRTLRHLSVSFPAESL
jgi:hypothetical protein